MDYTIVAAACDELVALARAARGDEAVLRQAEALTRLSRALGARSQTEAIEAVNRAAESAPSNRMFGTSMADLAEPLSRIKTIAEAFGAKTSVMNAIASLEAILSASAPFDARAIAHGLEALAAEEARAAAQKDAEKQAREAADREQGAAFARRLLTAPQTAQALGAILTEMKAHKPRLPAAAWKEAASLWARRDDGRSARAAREAIEAKIVKLTSSRREASAADRALASGF